MALPIGARLGRDHEGDNEAVGAGPVVLTSERHNIGKTIANMKNGPINAGGASHRGMKTKNRHNIGMASSIGKGHVGGAAGEPCDGSRNHNAGKAMVKGKHVTVGETVGHALGENIALDNHHIGLGKKSGCEHISRALH